MLEVSHSDSNRFKKRGFPWVWQLSTITQRREQFYQESATRGKIAQEIEDKRTLITSNSKGDVARTRAKRLGHPARAFGWVSVQSHVFLKSDWGPDP